MSDFLIGLGFGVVFLTVAWWEWTHVHWVGRGARLAAVVLAMLAVVSIAFGIRALISQ